MAGVSFARTGRGAVSTAVAVAVFRKSRLSISSSRRAQGDEKLVQLRERLGHRIFHPGVDIESFLGGIEFVIDQQRLATSFLEGHGADRTSVTIVIRPDEARVRRYFLVRAEKRHL